MKAPCYFPVIPPKQYKLPQIIIHHSNYIDLPVYRRYKYCQSNFTLYDSLQLKTGCYLKELTCILCGRQLNRETDDGPKIDGYYLYDDKAHCTACWTAGHHEEYFSSPNPEHEIATLSAK